jgi:rhamnosyltransferase subunit B
MVMAPTQLMLCTLGTRGDFEPFLALASLLRERGHATTLLTNANWRERTEAAGVGFHAIAEEDEAQSGRDDYRFFLGNTLPSFRRSFDYVAARAEARVPMLLLYRANMLGMQCAAERFDIPNGRVVLQPSAIKSCARPPWPMTIATQGRLGWLGRRLVVPAIYAAGEATSPYRRHSNAFRRSVGVPERSLFRTPPDIEDFLLMMCPGWFAMPQTDWPPNSYLVGFPFADVGQGDAELERFLAEEAPIVFTPGTGISDTGPFFDRAAQALALTGRRGLFLSRTIPERHRGNPGILCRDFVDLGWLLPRAAAFVHHGGIGSTAQGLRAGIPQLVVPGRFDQPDNAMRVASLGLGAAVMSDRYSGADWAVLLERTLVSEHVRTQLATAARLIAAEDAIRNSADIVEHFATEAGLPLPPRPEASVPRAEIVAEEAA